MVFLAREIANLCLTKQDCARSLQVGNLVREPSLQTPPGQVGGSSLPGLAAATCGRVARPGAQQQSGGTARGALPADLSRAGSRQGEGCRRAVAEGRARCVSGLRLSGLQQFPSALQELQKGQRGISCHPTPAGHQQAWKQGGAGSPASDSQRTNPADPLRSPCRGSEASRAAVSQQP